MRQWRLNNRKRLKEIQVKSYEKCKAGKAKRRAFPENRIAARTGTAKWRSLLTKEEKQDLKRLTVYGIGSFEVALMIAEQQNKCPICDKPLGLDIHIDHDHDTGVVRGATHPTCNRAIGMLKEDPEILVRASEYIRRFKVE